MKMAENKLSAALQALQLDPSEQSKSRKAQFHPRRAGHSSAEPTKHGRKHEGVNNPEEQKRPGNNSSSGSTRQSKAQADHSATDHLDSQSETPGKSAKHRSRRRGKPRRNTSDKPAPTTGRSSIDHKDDSQEHQSLSQIYVVQKMRPSEEVIGVYCQLQRANDRATEYLHTKHGISAREISDCRGIFDRKDRNVAIGKATKRVWATGAVELLTRGGQSWIRVLPKEWKAAGQSGRPEVVYLALDECKGLFVVGAYATMEEAWEGCRKYWMALAVCAPLENMKESRDSQDVPHARARTMGKNHHWFVRRYDAQ
ncbi:hypothetical protein P170DRAFT_132963 [Aspergillus steynii IBT 23096]|uniref:Uncharacterized protein n=1 Tax=Aspergillus steynii IBT 23096 TaxID=1392250 RepID=A0A2I2GAH5_9EURO|nr:uncharacterized protein P170DRAFT_132963 [Aspergillus steynii IBT 23096]PLB49874.1 hypothetical protein P170DRAFT_132963 [Aspergillus steynii IBT 23096]